MSDVNSVTITGRLTRDPEVISDGKGTRFGIASNRSYRRAGEDEWQEEVTYITVTAWSGLGKRVASKLRKASFCTVQGRLELNTWEQDGEKRSQLRIVALEVQAPDFYAKAEPEPLPDAA